MLTIEAPQAGSNNPAGKIFKPKSTSSRKEEEKKKKGEGSAKDKKYKKILTWGS